MIFYRLSVLLIVSLALLATGSTGANGQVPPGRNPEARKALESVQESKRLLPKVGRDLRVLYEEYDAHQRGKGGPPFEPSNRLMRLREDMVVIDAVAAGDAGGLLTDLEALGLQDGATFKHMVSGWLPITSIGEMAALNSLRFARSAYAQTNVGLTTSQGDEAMYADLARAIFSVDGTGVTVGTLSDSYNCLGGAATDVATGDLPPGVIVLMEDPGCSLGSDEGRAMMQLIADVAPGASQAFHTAIGGRTAFASGIISLAVAGADVIVDDILYLNEPMFQDGIIAQAVDFVAAAGIPYFSSAGNYGRNSQEEVYRPGIDPVFGLPSHDFDPGAGTDFYQSVTIPEGTEIRVVLQWDSPYASASGGLGSFNDVDVYLLDNAAFPVASSVAPNIGADPIEILSFFNPIGSGVTAFNLYLNHFAGPVPFYFKYVLVNSFSSGITVNEYFTFSGTSYGHFNATGAETVGAAAYFETPRFGTDPPLIEPFSSAGPTPIFFDLFDIPIFDLRLKPEIVGPDQTNTTFFVPGNDIEPDGFPNFSGTSAAAPHAAAVAALLLELHPALSPAGIYSALESTGDDMGPPGFDFDSGFGLVQADFALNAVIFADGFESGDTSAWN